MGIDKAGHQECAAFSWDASLREIHAEIAGRDLLEVSGTDKERGQFPMMIGTVKPGVDD